MPILNADEFGKEKVRRFNNLTRCDSVSFLKAPVALVGDAAADADALKPYKSGMIISINPAMGGTFKLCEGSESDVSNIPLGLLKLDGDTAAFENYVNVATEGMFPVATGRFLVEIPVACVVKADSSIAYGAPLYSGSGDDAGKWTTTVPKKTLGGDVDNPIIVGHCANAEGYNSGTSMALVAWVYL